MECRSRFPTELVPRALSGQLKWLLTPESLTLLSRPIRLAESGSLILQAHLLFCLFLRPHRGHIIGRRKQEVCELHSLSTGWRQGQSWVTLKVSPSLELVVLRKRRKLPFAQSRNSQPSQVRCLFSITNIS